MVFFVLASTSILHNTFLDNSGVLIRMNGILNTESFLYYCVVLKKALKNLWHTTADIQAKEHWSIIQPGLISFHEKLRKKTAPDPKIVYLTRENCTCFP